MKEYKYKLSLATQVKPLVQEDTDKYLAIASKSKLKDFLPINVDFDKKVDFLGFSGEFCTVNRLNGNDDAIQTKEALDIVKLLPFSFIDTEHSRKAIIGVITSAHFNEFGTNKVLSEDEVKDLNTPFNISVAGIIWRLVNPELSDYIESSGDPDSLNYGKIFLSWELLFDKANLVEIDANKKNIKDGNIITDESVIEKLENKLKANGGKGYTDTGKRLGRIPIDEIIPAGCALTENPAGEDLKPIKILSPAFKVVEKDNSQSELKETIENKILETIDAGFSGFSDTSTKEDSITTTNKDIPPKKPDYKFGKCPNCGNVSDYDNFIKTWNSSEGVIGCDSCTKTSLATTWEFNENNIWKGKDTAENKLQEKNKEILSHLENTNVKKDSKLMKISSIKDITDENLKESNASQILEVLNSEIQKFSTEFSKKKEEQENLVTNSNKKFEETNAALEITAKELKDVKANLDQLIKDNQEKAKLESFSARMETIDNKFDLNDKEKEILGSKIKAIDKDEDFTKFLEETEILLAAKKKVMKPTKKDKDPDKDGDDDTNDKGDTDKDFAGKKDSKASKEEVKENVVEEVVKAGEKKEVAVANTTSGSGPSLAERMNTAFNKDNWFFENKKKNRI